MRGALPFFLRHASVGFGRRGGEFLNRVEDGIRILGRRHKNLQLIPQPLPVGGEIEKMSFDGEAVDEGHLSAGGMPAAVQLPVSSSTVRSKPISVTSPTRPLISTQSPTRMPLRPMRANHPKKATMASFMATVRPAPAKPRMVGICVGHAEQYEEDKQDSQCLRQESRHRAHGSQPPAVLNEMRKIDREPIQPIDTDDNQQNQQHRLHDAVNGCALLRCDHDHPVPVNIGEILMVLHAFIQIGKILLPVLRDGATRR